MTEPQVWTLIAVFAATMFGTLTFGFNTLRSEMRSGFESVNKRIDSLERDVHYLIRKEFGDSPSA